MESLTTGERVKILAIIRSSDAYSLKMENVALDLKRWEEKQRSFSKMLEKLHSLGSSEVGDLHKGLKLMRSSLQTQLERLMEREKEILLKESQFESVLLDLEEKKRDVESIQSLIYMKCDELELKQNQYNAIQISVKEKEVEFEHLQKSVSEAAKKLKLLEKTIDQKSKEAESKSNGLDLIQEMLKKFDDITQLVEKQLNVMRKSFDDCSKEYELKKEQLKQCQISIEDCGKEVKLKENTLNLIQSLIDECSKKLELKEKRLDVVRKLKERNLESLRKSMKQYAYEFEMKEQKWESLVKELEMKDELHESKFEELDLMHKKVNDCLIEVETKEKNLALLQGLVEKRFGELEMKESEFERRNQFKLAKSEFELIRKSTKSGLKEVKLERLEPSYQSCMTKEKKDLYESICLVGTNEQASQLRPAICSVENATDAAESIQKLIERGEIIHAIRHVCELKLTDKFSPVPLLIEYLEDAENYTTLFCREKKSVEEKKKVADKEAAALRAAMECLKDFNLDSEFPSDKIPKRICALENKDRAFALGIEQMKKRRRISSLCPLDQPSQQGNIKHPQPTAKSPGGCVKMNFCCARQSDCSFLSVVARNTNGTVLSIWCRKTPRSDPLAGEALAAHGALTLASSSEWEEITLEGDSEVVISYLQGSCEPGLAISNIVSKSVGLLRSFKSAVPICVTPEANAMAHNVSQWAVRNNVQDGPSWMSVPSSLFYIFFS